MITKGSHRSHISGKRQNRFSQKIKSKLEKQCKRLEKELRKK